MIFWDMKEPIMIHILKKKEPAVNNSFFRQNSPYLLKDLRK